MQATVWPQSFLWADRPAGLAQTNEAGGMSQQGPARREPGQVGLQSQRRCWVTGTGGGRAAVVPDYDLLLMPCTC